jgi:copper chaperone CopZ
MVCEGCAEKIHKALTPLAGVLEVTPKVPQKHLYVRYQPSQVREQHIKAAIGEAGFVVLEA